MSVERFISVLINKRENRLDEYIKSIEMLKKFIKSAVSKRVGIS